MATDAERKAAFDVAEDEVITIVKQFAPGFMQAGVVAKITGNPAICQRVVDRVLSAAETARAAK